MKREIILTYDVTDSGEFDSARLKEYLCAYIFIYSYIFIRDNETIAEMETLEDLQEYFLNQQRTLTNQQRTRNNIDEYLELEFPTESTILIKILLPNTLGDNIYANYTTKLGELFSTLSEVMYFYLGLIIRQLRKNIFVNISDSNSKEDWDTDGETMLTSAKGNLNTWTELDHVIIDDTN